jgi:ketosteroid isomerase-like protein
MQPRKHLLATCSVLLMAVLVAACAAPAAAPAPPTDTPVPPAAESDPVAVIKAWADAIYSSDVDAALSYFTDDGKYLVGYTADGKEQMRGVFDWLASLETKHENFDCQAQDGKIACTYAVLDGCIAAFNAEGLPVKATFALQDGKIKEAVGSGTGPEWNAYWDFTSTSGSWMRVFRPEEYARFQEGTVEGGKLIVKLCREYENAVKTQGPATTAAAQGLVNAINSGNADAALAFLTDDAKFAMLNDKAAGVEELRSMFDWLAGRETQFQISDCEWKGISTQCAMTVVDGCVMAFGTRDGLPGKMTFSSLEDGTLRNVSSVLAGAERKSYGDWIEAERAWANENRADELAQAEGYSQPAGAMVVKLCQEYAETLK